MESADELELSDYSETNEEGILIDSSSFSPSKLLSFALFTLKSLNVFTFFFL